MGFPDARQVDSVPGGGAGMTDKSRGHIFFAEGTEYFQFENSIFQVPASHHMHTNGTLKGIRIGARFYCTMAAWPTSPTYRCYPELHTLTAIPSKPAPVPMYERGDLP